MHALCRRSCLINGDRFPNTISSSFNSLKSHPKIIVLITVTSLTIHYKTSPCEFAFYLTSTFSLLNCVLLLIVYWSYRILELLLLKGAWHSDLLSGLQMWDWKAPQDKWWPQGCLMSPWHHINNLHHYCFKD